MASATPAAFLSLGASHGAIASGYRADLAWLDATLRPRETWIGGAPVSTRE
jgi:N-acetylglucosamine-6-phosphate deacetylase